MAFVNYADILREFNKGYNFVSMHHLPGTDKDYREEVLRDIKKNMKVSFSEENIYKIPKPVKIIEGVSKKNGRTSTIVFWNDGTKTKVKNIEQDKPDRYMAFCAALAKKVYGSTDKAQKTVEKLLVKE